MPKRRNKYYNEVITLVFTYRACWCYQLNVRTFTQYGLT